MQTLAAARWRLAPPADRALGVVGEEREPEPYAHNEGVSTKGTAAVILDPDAPGLDEMTRRRRNSLEKLRGLPTEKILALGIRAGIYTADGELTEPYRAPAGPSPSLPTD